MKKNKNKGFLLTELLVTATLVSTVLVFLYTQFYSIKKSYENSFKYNTINGLYVLDNIRSFLIENGDVYANVTPLSNEPYYIKISEKSDENNNCQFIGVTNQNYFCRLFEKANIKTLYLVSENLDNFKNYLNDIQDTNKAKNLDSLRKFINYVDYTSNDSGEYRLIAEFEDGTFATLLVGGNI